jgi:hypothetical protein
MAIRSPNLKQRSAFANDGQYIVLRNLYLPPDAGWDVISTRMRIPCDCALSGHPSVMGRGCGVRSIGCRTRLCLAARATSSHRNIIDQTGQITSARPKLRQREIELTRPSHQPVRCRFSALSHEDAPIDRAIDACTLLQTKLCIIQPQS